MSREASLLSVVLPELREIYPDIAPPGAFAANSDAAVFSLHEAAARCLFRAAERQRFVLVLDDLQWADERTLDMLVFLVRELRGRRVLVVGAYRDVELARGSPLDRALGRLSHERHCEHLALPAWSLEEVRRYVAGERGLEARTTERIYDLTQGNPLFVRQMLDHFAQSGTAVDSVGATRASFRLPDSIREVIDLRLGRLSSFCIAVLRAAALIGLEFSESPLLEIFDGHREEVPDALEEAVRAHILSPYAERPGEYRFFHALMQECVVEGMKRSERSATHARIVAGLEASYGTDTVRHAAELLRHCLAADAHVGGEKTAGYALAAGRASLDATAWREALRQLEAGIAALGSAEPTTLLADLHIGAAHACSMLGRLDEIYRHQHSALDYCERAHDRNRVLKSVWEWRSSWRSFERVEALLKRARCLLEPGTKDEARLLHYVAYRQGWTGLSDRWKQTLREALGICESIGSEEEKA